MTPEFALKAILPIVIGLAAARTVGRRNPAAGHFALLLAFGWVLAIPPASALVPAWQVPLLPRSSAALPAPRPPAIPTKGTFSTSWPLPGPSKAEPPAVRVVRVRSTPALTLASATLVLWAFGVAVVALRAARGFVALHRLQRHGSVPLSKSDLPVDADPLAARVGMSRPWTLRRSIAEGASPMTWGLFRPVVLLPAESARWSAARLEAVLLHELAHARRGDASTVWVAELACAMHWFNPLAWSAARAMREAAERAADRAAVVRGGVRASDYAQELLSLVAEIRPVRRLLPTGVQAMNSPKIETRLLSVLSSDTSGLTLRQAALAGALAVAALPLLAAFRPIAPQAGPVGPERGEALRRAKALGVATLIYGQDYDETLPSGGTTAAVRKQVTPYVKDSTVFLSPTKDGRFLFNMHLAGVSLRQIDALATVPAWYEQLPDPAATTAVAYVDGHARLLPASQRGGLLTALARRFPGTGRRWTHLDPHVATRMNPTPAQSANFRLAQAKARLRQAQAEVEAAKMAAQRARRPSRPRTLGKG